MGKYQILTGLIFIQVVSYPVRRIPGTETISAFKIMILSIILAAVALSIETFWSTNQIKLQVWQILICYNQAFFHYQVARITFI